MHNGFYFPGTGMPLPTKFYGGRGAGKNGLALSPFQQTGVTRSNRQNRDTVNFCSLFFTVIDSYEDGYVVWGDDYGLARLCTIHWNSPILLGFIESFFVLNSDPHKEARSHRRLLCPCPFLLSE